MSTWKVLNDIIRNKRGKTGYQKHFLTKTNNTIDDMNLVANEFNEFFSTDEDKIFQIVKGFKNKKSTDWNDMDMSIVINIIGCLVKPITYIFNQSLKTGVFPNKMKTAEVIPVLVWRHILSNYRPFAILQNI